MNLTKLTNEELAALLYGIERFCDSMYEDDYLPAFMENAEKIRNMFTTEYRKRHLDCKQFMI